LLKCALMKISSTPEVQAKFESYPRLVKSKMLKLRKLVLSAGKEIDGLDKMEETLKWGEPSYLTKQGSTLRMDWKKNKPDQYALYFKCTSKLIPTFKRVYKDLFSYEGNRAIVFQLKQSIPEAELKRCITAGLTYHKVKQLPRLGL